MNFIFSTILISFLLFCTGSDNFSIKYSMLQSVLGYYKSRSVILVFDENENSVNPDLINFLNLQKELSSANFYLSTLTTTTGFRRYFQTTREGIRETVVTLTRNVTRYLEKVLREPEVTSYKWLLTTTEKLKDIGKLIIPLDSEITIAQVSPPFGCKLLEIYNVQPGKIIMKELGIWVSEKQQFHLKTKQDLYHRRKNLNGAVIKVLAPQADSCREISFSTGVASIVWCIHQRVWEVMAEMLNATTKIQIIPELTPEAILKTGAELTFRSAPLNVVDLNTRSYVWPLFRAQVEVVTSYVKQEVEWRTYVLPFSGQMWMVVLLWILSCDLILAGVEFAMKRKKKQSFWRYCGDFSFFTVFTFCSQGVLGPSKSLSVRIIFLMIFIVPGVLFPGYSAVLTSFLTVHLHKQPFRNLEELSRMKEYKLGWHNTFALEHMFNLKDLSPLNQALLQNNVLPEEKLPATDAEAIERICNETFSYLTIMDTVLALKPKCKYYKLKQYFKVVFTSMEMKKNSWYKYFVDRWYVSGIVLLQAVPIELQIYSERNIDFTGLLYRIKLQTVMNYVHYFEKHTIDTKEVPPIKIENIVLPFAVLLLGVVGSVGVLLLEMTCFKSKPAKRHRFHIPHRL